MPRAPARPQRVVVYNEGPHERTEPQVALPYPDRIGGAVIARADADVVIVTQRHRHISSFFEGEELRSGVCWTRAAGQVFFFSPGDQGCPVYHHPHIRRVIGHAARWAAPTEPVLRRFADDQTPAGWWAP